MRKLLVALTLCAAVACGSEQAAIPPSPTVPPTPTTTPKPTPDLGKFDIDLAMDHVRALGVEIGIREAGTDGDRRAAAYISERIERLGWSVTEQEFPLPQGGESTNVIGTPPGFDENEPYVIIGGHRDSLRGPGANDNATGIGVVLDVARAVDARPAPLPVVVVAFGAEERQPAPGRPHHVGSVYYVSKMSDEAKRNLAVMVNVDMVGHGDVITCGRIATGPRGGTQRCLDHGARLKIAVKERVTPDWSDHGSFAKAGMNTAWLWTGENPCCYHNPRDTIDTVRPGDVKRSGLLGLAIVRSYTR